jgi:hypothetical protein
MILMSALAKEINPNKTSEGVVKASAPGSEFREFREFRGQYTYFRQSQTSRPLTAPTANHPHNWSLIRGALSKPAEQAGLRGLIRH